MNFKIYIATPALNGKVNSSYAYSLADTILICNIKSIPCIVDILESSTLLVESRNVLLGNFLNSDATHLFCIDSDIAWNPESILEFLYSGHDVLSASYMCRRREEEFYHFVPIVTSEKTLVTNDKGYMKAYHAPAGFLMLSKKILQDLVDKNPTLWYKTKGLKDSSFIDVPFLFNTELINNKFYGEDYAFCNLLAKNDIEIWVNPFTILDHNGRKGRLIDTLVDKETKKDIYNKLGRTDL